MTLEEIRNLKEGSILYTERKIYCSGDVLIEKNTKMRLQKKTFEKNKNGLGENYYSVHFIFDDCLYIFRISNVDSEEYGWCIQVKEDAFITENKLRKLKLKKIEK